MKLSFNKSILLGIPVVMLMASCKKDKKEEIAPETPSNPNTPSYTVPSTYSFTSQDFSSSTARITMLGEITGYIRSAHTTTQTTQPTLDAQKLKEMFANSVNHFTNSAISSSTLQLKDQTSITYNLASILESSYDDAATASVFAATTPTTQSASSGVAGKLISPSRAILVDAKGLEYKEQTEKGLMGAVFYYQAATLLTNIATYTTQASQAKAWDEAFGYFGVPVDFPTNTTGLKNWGSYCNAVNSAIGSNTTIMNAFLKGRAAIVNNDATGRDEAKNTVLKTWEKVAAAKCINYMKGAKTNFAQDADRHHNLSEGIGFIEALRYNPSKTITDAQITALLENFLDDNNMSNVNLYNVTTAEMDNIINSLATIFSLDPNTL